MPKTKIYTRTGDAGESLLLSVGRVPKNHLRLTAYGDIDELNSLVGVAQTQALAAPLPAMLAALQARLFVLSSQVAVPHPEQLNFDIPRLQHADIDTLERDIDQLDAGLPELKNFVLPGGSGGSAYLHLARTVCRRCERSLQTLHQSEPLPGAVLQFINRLSDFFFTAARYDNQQAGFADATWSPDQD